MSTMEDQLWNFVYKATTDKFMEFIEEKEPKIREIVGEVFNDDMARDWLKDFVEYDDQLREMVRDRVMDILVDKLVAQLENTREK